MAMSMILCYFIANLDDFPPPNDFITTTDLSLREVTFKWSKSPVQLVLDCPSLHYNITSSNCGSCPTTTTNTTVTCTDIPTETDASMCTFSIESIVCGKVVNLFNDTIHIPMNMTDTSSCDYGFYIAIASTSSVLAGMSFVYATVVTVLMIVNKRKKKATRKTTEQESPDVLYEDVELPEASASTETVVDTRVNIAYGQVMPQTGN